MESAEELRAEARRLIETANNLSDPQSRKELATRALALSERAEAIARTIENPEIIQMNIARYRSLLAAEMHDQTHRKIVEEFLADAEALLANLQKRRNRERAEGMPHASDE